MNTVSNAPIWGLIVSMAGPVIRILRDRFTPPQRGLRYFDLEMRPDDQQFDRIADGDDKLKDAPQHDRKPYTHFIKLANYGREVIDEGDYIRPFCVHYGEAAQVIGYRIIRDDRAIHPKIYDSRPNASGILIKEILNPGDTLTLGVLLAVSGNPEKPSIDCRVKGVPHLRGHVRGTPWLRVLRHLAVHYFSIPLAIIGGLVTGYRVFLAINLNNQSLQDAIGFLTSR
jgi:hypothetical protein